MGKMSDISIRLEQFKADLYNFGIHDENVVAECNALYDMGFTNEIECIIHDFEYFIVTNEG